MKRTSRKLASGNLLLAIGVLAAYAVCGKLFQLNTDHWFLGFHAGHLGRGGGPLIAAWVVPVAFESFILLRIIGERFAGWKRASIPLSAWFGLIAIAALVSGPLLRAAWSAVIRSQFVQPAYDVVLAWSVWVSHLFYGFAALRRMGSGTDLQSGMDEDQQEQS